MEGYHSKYSFRTFLILATGQTVSIVGSGLTGFTLGIWIYQKTHSATQFALIMLCAFLPAIFISPVAGVIVDRYNRKWVMIAADTGAGLCTLSVALLFITGKLVLWHIFLFGGLTSMCGAFQSPAFTSTFSLLVSEDQLGRANGLWQTGQSLGQIVSPVVAGFLVIRIGVQGVMMIDFATFLFAVTTTLAVRFPRLEISPELKKAQMSLFSEFLVGVNYVRHRAGLFSLLGISALSNYCVGIIIVLFTPMMLNLTTPETLGRVFSIGGFGGFLGGVLLSVWGGPKRKIMGFLGFMFVSGLFTMLCGLKPSMALIAGALFGVFFTIPLINGCDQVIWQKKIPPEIQGRVFSARNMIGMSMMPISFLCAGPFADRIFEPLFATGGALVPLFGPIFGTGPGRGIGFLFSILGLLISLITVIGYTYRPLRNVEAE
ncbi:MAG: MFS transporter [Candidatus Atribacteria bacterium]|nr:MFS transporter [Candidatus Atribacteria bacterium]